MERKNFAWPVTSIEEADHEAFFYWYEKNKSLLMTHKLAIWGAGIRGTTFSILLKEQGFHNILFVDSNPQKQGGYIDEFPIISPQELEQERAAENILILISPENSDGIQTELEDKGYQKDQDFFIVESGEYAAYVEEFLRPYGQKVLVMGDCEFSAVSLIDDDRSTLQDKLFQRCGKDNTKILAMHGMGLRAEYNIFHAQILEGMKPEKLIIMVNFDTLTGKQHLLPRSQHAELLGWLLSVQKNPSEEFLEYVQLAQMRSKNLQMEFFTGPEHMGQISEVQARNYFRLNYLYKLNIETEGMLYLIRILREAHKENINVLPFIPPVNYQLGRKLLGDVFDSKYADNLNKVKHVVAAEASDLLDLSYSLSADLFATEMTANETTNSLGREKVADLLYAAIQEMK